MGVSHEVDLPVTWGSDESIAWKTEVPPYGNSSPVVSGGRVYLTSSVKREGKAGQLRTVLAYDFASGAPLWETEVLAAPGEQLHRVNTAAAPTPATDGERLYVYFGSDLAALDLDGNVLWRQTIDAGYRDNSRYGASTSPVLTNEAVVILQDREYADTEDPGWIAAYGKEDGRELWRHEWNDTCCTYSTPVVVDRGAGEELIVALSRWVQGRDARTGELLWSADYEINQLVSSPVIDGELLIVAGGAHGVRQIKGFRLTGVGRETAVEELWSTKRMVPETASPVVYDGLFFSISTQGVMTCRELLDGKLVWRERLQQRGNHGSLVAGDGKVYAVSGWGFTAVIAASREYQLLAENVLPDFEEGRAVASPAIAEGALLLRSENHLYKIVGGSGSSDGVAGSPGP
jgi:outer membrane protein assembly factor BamB